MDFDFDYILENERVKLSPLKIHHLSDLLEIANEPDIWKYSFLKGNGRKNLTEYIRYTIDNRTKGKDYPFIVYDKQFGAFAGSTRLYDILENSSALRIGYTWYGQRFRGTGLNKHCKYLLFNFVFEKLNFDRIGLGAYIDNVVSIEAMKSVGCIQEGIFRSFLPSPDNSGRTDAILFSILREEWLEDKKQLLEQKLFPNPVPPFRLP